MSANSIEAFFSIGIQSAKGTAATTLYKTLATVSMLDVRPKVRDNRIEHPSASSAWRRTGLQTHRNFLANATVTFVMRPKFIVPVLMAMGYQDTPANNTTYYTHALVQGTNANHKWATIAWSVPDTAAAYVTRGVDCRCNNLQINVTPDEIQCTATFLGLTVEPMSGSPTYVSEVTDEMLPWLGARTTMTAGVSGSEYTIAERVRGIQITLDNPLRDDDPAIWEETQTTLERVDHDVSYNFTGIDVTDSIDEAFMYGADAGSSVSTAARIGDVNLYWESADDISGASVPYRFEIDTPSVQWLPTVGSRQANGNDPITWDAVANVIANVATPVSIEVDNSIASY